MDFRDFFYFYEYAKGVPMTDLAEMYNISVSSASKHLHSLEIELGVALLDRSVRPMKLTRSGEILVEHLETLLPQYNEMIRAIKLDKLLLKFAMPLPMNLIDVYGFFENKTESDSLYKFERMKTPPYTVRELEELLQNNTLDFAISHDSAYWTDSVAKERIFSDSAVVVLPVNHPLTQYSVVSIEQIKDYNFCGNRGTAELIKELEAYTKDPIRNFDYSGNLRYKVFLGILSGQSISLAYQTEAAFIRYDEYGCTTRKIKELSDLPVMIVFPKESPQKHVFSAICFELQKYLREHSNKVFGLY